MGGRWIQRGLMLVALAAACGERQLPRPDPPSFRGFDASDWTATPDGSADAAPDAAADALLAQDLLPDRRADLPPPPDAAADAALAVDLAADRAPDARPDLAPDRAPDLAPDRTPDLAVDRAPDLGPDAPVDAPADAPVDAPADLALFLPVDAPAPDAPVDAPPDLGPDLGPDAAPLGSACVRAGDCASGFCVDGRCCGVERCEGQCNFCIGPGGTCEKSTFFGAANPQPEGCASRFACRAAGGCQRLNGQPCLNMLDCLDMCVAGTCQAQSAHAYPPIANFGTVPVGTSLTFTVSILNYGNQPVVFQVQLEQGDRTEFEIVSPTPCVGQPLPVGGFSCNIHVRFTPTATGLRTAALRVSNLAAQQLSQSSLAATGTSPTSPSIAQTTQQLPGGGMGNYQFEVTNPAGGLPVDSIAFENARPGSFEIVGMSCQLPLPAGATCTVDIRYDTSLYMGFAWTQLVARSGAGLGMVAIYAGD